MLTPDHVLSHLSWGRRTWGLTQCILDRVGKKISPDTGLSSGADEYKSCLSGDGRLNHSCQGPITSSNPGVVKFVIHRLQRDVGHPTDFFQSQKFWKNAFDMKIQHQEKPFEV